MELVGVGVAEFVKDGQGLAPVVPGGVVVAGDFAATVAGFLV
ncbi:hypothetical protein [Phytohabitans aurantiacus]|nr:hypothetical protein [Phytohabitans aurantiacus]